MDEITAKILHAIVFGLLMGGTHYALRQFAFYTQAGRGKQFLIFFVAAFVVILVLNLVWPYPS